MRSRALGLLLGYAADRLIGDPRRFHPVAGFGKLAGVLERLCYGDSRVRGAMHVAVLTSGAAGLGLAVERRSPPTVRTLVVATATWAVLGGRTLEREANAVHGQLCSADPLAARVQVKRLVGRQTDGLDVTAIARAVVESVAENTSDAVVAPLVWGGLFGPAGLFGYRAVNTLDAMVGHHGRRYERFGWAAARLDDLVNLPAARLAALLVLVTDPCHADDAWTAWRRDARRHPSPNAGVVEAAFAGALGVRLGGTNLYAENRTEHRAVMGSGRTPVPGDIPAANRLSRRVGLAAVLVAALAAVGLPCHRGRR